MSVSQPFSFLEKSTKLPDIYHKRAKKELHEDSNQVSAHLESFRRWIKSMPHLKCPITDEFLLSFLRHAKFHHAKAQTRLDNFCTFRTSETEGSPIWFQMGERREEVWKSYMQMGCLLPLGYMSDGTSVTYMKLAKFDLSKIAYDDAIAASEMWNDLMLMDERMQIGGMIFIMDASGLTKKCLTDMWRPKDSKKGMKYFQECVPFRIRQLIYYNVPTFFEAIFKLASVWFNEKIKSRIMVIKDDLQPAFDKFDGLKEILPKDCGGNNKSFEKLLVSTRSLLEQVPKYSPGFDISVDESKRPQTARNLMKEYKDIPENLMGVSGTFIKLNEDEI